MTDEAIRFIREHCPPEGYFVAFSGGKDSIVSLELVRMAGVKHQVYYSATGIDPPEVVRFIKQHYPEVVWLRPKMSFWEGIQRKDPPTRWQRWCCDVLKKDATKSISLKHHIVGMRSEESASRKMRGRIDYNPRMKKWNYKPIFDWKTWHIWDFIEAHQISYPSLYDEGFERVGCVVCPFICHKGGKYIIRNRNRWPYLYKTMDHALKKWFASNREEKDKRYQTASEYANAWYNGFE